MNREIKFRAWDADEKEMAYMDDEYADINYTPNENIANFFNFYYGCEMLQFTGYRDKDGGEIYEKDLVEWQRKIWVIHFGDGSARYCLFDPAEGAYDITHGERENYKIIGNIFQNPELLK